MEQWREKRKDGSGSIGGKNIEPIYNHTTLLVRHRYFYGCSKHRASIPIAALFPDFFFSSLAFCVWYVLPPYFSSSSMVLKFNIVLM